MARERMRMKKTREVLRLHFNCGLANQQISNAVRVSKGSVFNYIARFKNSGLVWPLPPEMSDSQLVQKLFPEKQKAVPEEIGPDFKRIHTELCRPHVTLELLWEEYRNMCPEGLSRSSFYRHYDDYRTGLPVEMKVIHKGGDKLFVDYSGKKLKYWDRQERSWVEVELFVASWGASSFCYCEASASQSGQDWVSSHIRALEYFGCVPAAIVPDNLKSGVTKAVFYEPEINALYKLMAEHYETAILPARVRKPKDKAVVESNVLHLQRFIFGRLRDRTFYSLNDLNEAIWELLDQFNDRPMQQYRESRRQRFDQLDLPCGAALPAQRFRFTQVKTDVRVAPNYHIEFDKHFYSVPYEFVRKTVDVYQSGAILEIYHDGQHVCRHKKQLPNYRYTTIDEHMPPQHKFVKGWSAPWFIAQAHKIGEATAELISRILDGKRHPEQGFRSAMGVLNLKKQYPEVRIEQAARRALHFGNTSYHAVKNILAKKLDEESLHKPVQRPALQHDNIRGQHYYNQ